MFFILRYNYSKMSRLALNLQQSPLNLEPRSPYSGQESPKSDLEQKSEDSFSSFSRISILFLWTSSSGLSGHQNRTLHARTPNSGSPQILHPLAPKVQAVGFPIPNLVFRSPSRRPSLQLDALVGTRCLSHQVHPPIPRYPGCMPSSPRAS